MAIDNLGSANAISATVIDAKGDLVTATAADTPARLAVGSDGQMLMADSGATTGLRYVDPPTNRNLLHNGAMQVAQRGTSTAGITLSSYNTVDRWYVGLGTLGTWTQSVEADGPTGSGLSKSLKMLVTTADASPAAGDTALVTQLIEGQDVQRIAKGTASAQQLTLSFWVKSNVTGTCIAELRDYDNTRTVSASYTISSSATWERKSITFPADTTGTLDNDNAASFAANFWLAAGSNFTSGTLATTWAATTSANRAVGQTNLAAATNNYWQITGVQLEVGPVATPFEFKSFGQELAECQRYYWRVTSPSAAYHTFAVGQATTTTVAYGYHPFPVPMRDRPTAIEQTGTASHYAITNSSFTPTACNAVPTNYLTTPYGATFQFVVASGLTAGNACFLMANSTASAYLGWSADL